MSVFLIPVRDRPSTSTDDRTTAERFSVNSRRSPTSGNASPFQATPEAVAPCANVGLGIRGAGGFVRGNPSGVGRWMGQNPGVVDSGLFTGDPSGVHARKAHLRGPRKEGSLSESTRQRLTFGVNAAKAHLRGQRNGSSPSESTRRMFAFGFVPGASSRCLGSRPTLDEYR